MIPKWNANFSILGPKNNTQKTLKIFLHLYQFVDYNEVLFSRSTFHEKSKKNYRVFDFVHIGQKRTWTFFCLSSTLIWNSKHVGRDSGLEKWGSVILSLYLDGIPSRISTHTIKQSFSPSPSISGSIESNTQVSGFVLFYIGFPSNRQKLQFLLLPPSASQDALAKSFKVTWKSSSLDGHCQLTPRGHKHMHRK